MYRSDGLFDPVEVLCIPVHNQAFHFDGYACESFQDTPFIYAIYA